MASYNALLSVSAAFPFNTPEHWLKWECCFQQYRLASGLLQESEEHQVNTLLYCLSEEAEDILASTNTEQEDREKYDNDLAKFDSFCSVRKNFSNFGELKDKLICDRIVVGIRDASLSEGLQMDLELTLEKAKTVV